MNIKNIPRKIRQLYRALKRRIRVLMYGEPSPPPPVPDPYKTAIDEWAMTVEMGKAMSFLANATKFEESSTDGGTRNEGDKGDKG